MNGPVLNRLPGTILPQFKARSGNWWRGAETALIQILPGVRSQAEDTMCDLTRSPLTEFVRLQRIRVNSKTLNSINSEDYTRSVTQRVNLVTEAAR